MRQRSLGPDDSRNPVRRSKHGLSAVEVDDLISLQGGCAICGRRDVPLQIDHDHKHCPGKTGCRLCVRGAVCHRCNKVLYLVEDKASLAQSFAAYLIRTSPR